MSFFNTARVPIIDSLTPKTLLDLIESAKNIITSELGNSHEKMGVTTHMFQKGFTNT